MAHTGIYATSAECIAKAGDNYPSTICTESRINEFNVMSESTINVAGLNVFATTTATFAALDSTVRGLLTDVSSSLVGINMLGMKPSGEDGAMVRIEFEDRINILRDGALRGLSILRDSKSKEILKTGS